MRQNIYKYRIYLILLIGVIYVLLPLYANPHYYLLHQNDLTEFFWPLIEYSKKSIIQFHTIPLWNPLWFAGQPLLADPQAPILYLPNIIFLFLPTLTAFLLSISLHLYVAGLFFYFFLREILKDEKASLVGSILYISAPRFAASVEAGHFGLMCAWTWIAGCLFFYTKMSREKTVVNRQILYLSISIGFLFICHAITAAIIVSAMLSIGLLTLKDKKRLVLQTILVIAIVIMILSSVVFPQLYWQSITTRSLLVNKPELFPLWNSKKEFFMKLAFDIFRHKDLKFDTEKVIYPGILTIFLGTLGIYSSSKFIKSIAVFVFILCLLISLNNASPIYPLLLHTPLISLMRVTTRVWIIVTISLSGFCAYYISKIRKFKLILSTLVIINSFVLTWSVFDTPHIRGAQATEEVYQYIYENPRGRTWCVDHCFNQSLSEKYNIETIDGYATIQQKNYYNTSWGLFGGYWDYYTLAIPPFGITSTQTLRPDYQLLGMYNVGYIISSKALHDTPLKYIRKIDDYYLYENKYNKPAVYTINSSRELERELPVQTVPNRKIISANTNTEKTVIVSQTYSPGWLATTNTGMKLEVVESPEKLMQLTVPAHTSSVILEYSPPGLRKGLYVAVLTFILVLFVMIYLQKIDNSANKK